MRIAFISNDYRQFTRFGTAVTTPGGAAWYRCALPAKSLSEFGEIDALAFPDGIAAHDGEIVPLDDRKRPHPGNDVIVLQRWMLPNTAEVTKRARAAGQIVIQDVDDHFWAVHWSHAAHRANDPSRNADWNTDHYTEAIKAANLVTVSTPYLADVICDLGQLNVAVLANMIDLRSWTRQPVHETVRTIGWVGTTAQRSNDLQQLGNALRRFLRDNPQTKFIHGGHSDRFERASKLLNIPSSRTIRRPTEPIDRYPRLWNGIDLAICPLNPIPFNRAKSAIKAMEASAAGVPYIATDLDAYRDYGCGQLVTTPKEWEEALKALGENLKARSEMADQAHERVQRDDVSRRWTDWLTCYESVR